VQDWVEKMVPAILAISNDSIFAKFPGMTYFRTILVLKYVLAIFTGP
jgi:hypothetical protein